MKLVLDNNILFSLFNPLSAASYLFSSIKSEFLAPEFINFESEKYKDDILLKSNLSLQEFEMRHTDIKELIKFFENSEYKEFISIAINNLEDPKDSPYLALALSTNSAIWSNDPHLKEQSLVPVFTTEDLLVKFLKREI